MTALEASMVGVTVCPDPKRSDVRIRAAGQLAIALMSVVSLAHAHQASEPAEGLHMGVGLLAASAGQQVPQEPSQDSALSPTGLNLFQPENFYRARAQVSQRLYALQQFSLRAAYARDRLWHADSPLDARLGPRPVEGWRVVEVSPVFDPLRPFQRPSRALEMPAAGTTAFAQELGLPMQACIHRFRVPSRISDNGSFSIKAQWNVGCRF
jgi:hypothetical protein